MKKIQDSKGYTNKIVQHSQVIYNIEDIVDLYSKLQNDNLTFEKLGQGVDKYLRTITTTFKLKNRLKNMILGQGILNSPGRDIFNSYKRDYSSETGAGCSVRYDEDIKSEFFCRPRENRKMWHMLTKSTAFTFCSEIPYGESINVVYFFCLNLFSFSRKYSKTVTSARRYKMPETRATNMVKRTLLIKSAD